MDRIVASGTSATPPTAPVGTPGYPQNNTVWTAYQAHAITEEIRALIVAGGGTPDTATLTQLRDAVLALLAMKAPLASPALTGNPTAPTAAPGDNDTSIATTAFVAAAIAALAPLASPTFTGDPKAPTPSTGDNDTSIATTAFVQAQIALSQGGIHRSAPQSYTGDFDYVLNHNIGADPKDIRSRVLLICTSTDWGFPVGYVLEWVGSTMPDNANGMLTVLTSTDGNTTTARIKSHLNVSTSAFANVSLTAGKWNVVVESWARGYA